MVKRATIITIFFVILSLSQVVHCTTSGIQDGINRAKEENKAILIYFFSKYCGYCTEMERDVLKSSEISAMLKRDIIYLGVDVEKNADAAIKYGVRGYPTTILMDDKGKMMARIPGYIPREDFRRILRFLSGKYYKNTDLMSYIKNDKKR